jgi:hypothetical protein
VSIKTKGGAHFGNLCWVSSDVDGSAECMRSFIFAGAGIGGEDGIDVRLGEAGGGSG